MKAIEGKLRSRYQTEHKVMREWNPLDGTVPEYDTVKRWNRFDGSVSQIRKTEGYAVRSFRELIDEVAAVTVNNRQYEMFYRGQAREYMDSRGTYYAGRSPKTTVYPSICRPGLKADGTPQYRVRRQEVEARYARLHRLVKAFCRGRSLPAEVCIALFQHYGIVATPFIDITQSLRVAATFALRSSQKGYLYVFGLPFPNQSISYFYDLGIVLLKLQNICPVEAKRPRYQEGYLVGKFPYNMRKEGEDNLARRLVAKFCLDNTDGTFWDEHFSPMPDEVLFPADDPIEQRLRDGAEQILSEAGL
ncbi:MAG: FRG domain-containing protein [Rikenellaceae bacterium]|nr:FRG domain-containing protein [Rikenellaceae bacterium]